MFNFGNFSSVVIHVGVKCHISTRVWTTHHVKCMYLKITNCLLQVTSESLKFKTFWGILELKALRHDMCLGEPYNDVVWHLFQFAIAAVPVRSRVTDFLACALYAGPISLRKDIFSSYLLSSSMHAYTTGELVTINSHNFPSAVVATVAPGSSIILLCTCVT